MTSHQWTFPARVRRVVDGDTLDIQVDLGFRAYSDQRIRLANVNTAEIYGVKRESEEYALGSEHKEFAKEWISDAREGYSNREGWPFTAETAKTTGKYGRWGGDLQRRDTGMWLTEALVVEFPDVEEQSE